jgi:hypothetical protein
MTIRDAKANLENTTPISLSLSEAADFLKLSPSALRQKAKYGLIPGAKIGKCWVFIQQDLAELIRSQYSFPRQALRVSTTENVQCYTNATKLGGSDLRPPTEREYDALLKRPAKPKPKNFMTN